MRITLFILCLLPLACGPGVAELDRQISAEARAAEAPSLVPLGPLLGSVESPQARSAQEEELTLEQRAAALQIRADALRNMRL